MREITFCTPLSVGQDIIIQAETFNYKAKIQSVGMYFFRAGNFRFDRETGLEVYCKTDKLKAYVID